MAFLANSFCGKKVGAGKIGS